MIYLDEFFKRFQITYALVLIVFFLMFIFFGKIDNEFKKVKKSK